MDEITTTTTQVSTIPRTPNRDKIYEVIATYLQNFLSDHTRKAYQKDFADFFGFLFENFGEIGDFAEVKKIHIIEYRNHLKANYSPKYLSRKMSALSSLFKELQNTNIIETNPVTGVVRPTAVGIRPKSGFTDEEVNQILEHYSEEKIQGLNNRAILTFLFYTGCRVSEMLSTKAKDIKKLDGINTIILRGKRDKFRQIPLHPKLDRILNELIRRREKESDDYLFTRVKIHSE